MKRWIRWQGLGAFLSVMIILSIIWLVFIDGFVERMIEKYGTKAVGAKVELAGADLSLFPAGLEFDRLQITNPDKPMTNAVEIDRITLSLDSLNLFRRKIIIEEMALDGLRLGTARKTSGAVVSRPAAPPAVPKKDRKGLCGEAALPTFEMPDVHEILKKEQLQSMKLAQSLQEDIETEEEKWQKILVELPGQEKFDEYRNRIQQLKSGTKSRLGALLSASGEVAALQKDLQRDLGRIKQDQQRFDDKVTSLKIRLDQAAKAPLKDVGRLKEKYSISSQGLVNMSRLVFGYQLCGWMQKAIAWYEKLKSVLEPVEKEEKGERGPEVIKPMRGSGFNVRFKEYAPLPDFLIRRVKTSLRLQGGDLAGQIKNITPDQDILGAPLTFEFSDKKMEGLHAIKIDGAMDRITPSRSKDKINFRLQGYEARDVTVSDKPEWPVTLTNALVDLQLRGVLSGDTITADLTAELRSVSLMAGVQDATSPLARAMGSALSDVSEFTIKADITGTLEEYDMRLTSDLDRVLKETAGKVVQKQAARLEKELKREIFAKVSPPLDQAKVSLGGFDAIGRELTSRLNLGNGLLKDLKLSF